MTGKVETAQNLPRDVLRGILGPMFGGVECDHADRVAVLAGHQIADDGFEIGFADIGFRECRASFSVIVDDEIKGLIVAVRHNRGDKAPIHKNSHSNRHGEFQIWNAIRLRYAGDLNSNLDTIETSSR